MWKWYNYNYDYDYYISFCLNHLIPNSIIVSNNKNGLSAYEIAVKNGFIGTEQAWLNSLVGETGKDGSNGDNGLDGVTPEITANAVSVPTTSPANVIQSGTIENPILTFEIPRGQDGLYAPKIYHADLSTSGKSIEIPLAPLTTPSPQPRIYIKYQYESDNSISIGIRAAGNAMIVDLKRTSQYGSAGSEGSSLDNATITTTPQIIDTLIYNDSSEMHKTWIRIYFNLTNEWWFYEISTFISNKGQRTCILVYPIYQNAKISWG